MSDIKDQIIEKQEELNSRHKSFVNWMLKYTPEILDSERGRNFIAEVEDVESELASLKSQALQERGEADIELENKLINFTNWYLRLIKVTTDKDERYDIENMEIVWSFLRGDDYKLWWSKFGKQSDSTPDLCCGGYE